MNASVWSDPKCTTLRKYATLNTHPERVGAALFQNHPFFDPRDLVQVKYEMLRQVTHEGQSIWTASANFGFSRVTFYQVQQHFAVQWLYGLLPQLKGPRRAYKLSEQVLQFLLQTLQEDPALRVADLQQRAAQQLGLSVHPRSIERALIQHRKKVGRSKVHPVDGPIRFA